MIANRHTVRHETAPNCVCGWDSAPDSAGGAHSALPYPVAGFKGRRGKGWKEREGDEGKGGKGKG